MAEPWRAHILGVGGGVVSKKLELSPNWGAPLVLCTISIHKGWLSTDTSVRICGAFYGAK